MFTAWRLLGRNIITRHCTTSTEKIQEKKPPILRRLGNYFLNILNDYKMVAVETGQDMKDRPLKAAFYISLLGITGYLAKTNPSLESFEGHLLENTNELLQLGKLVRNRKSDEHMQHLMWCFNEGRIRRLNLGVCSLIWKDNFGKEVDVFEAQCKSLKVGWMDMRDRTLDIGIAGRWLWLEKAMIDYDINIDEWPEETSNTSPR